MSRLPVFVSAGVLAATMASCGGDDGPSGGVGVVQLSDFRMNPATVGCGFTLTNPPKNIGSPDTVLMQMHVVNTTADDVSLTIAGTAGTVVRASAAGDVGQFAANFASLPYTPKDGVVPAKSGDVTMRVSLPTEPLCQAKPVGYLGWWDLDVSARITTSAGQYVTIPATIRFNWQ